MNRLILIGNGFDLAHGYKTSFKDFIDDYLENSIATVIENGSHEDILLSIKHKLYDKMNFPPDFERQFQNLREKVNYFKKDPWEFKTKSTLFNRILGKYEILNWVDIEIEFFEELLENISNPNFDPIVRETNLGLDLLKLKLVTYLGKSVTKIDRTKIDLNLKNRFIENFEPNEFSVFQLKEGDLNPKKILFLNFNYTNTIYSYIDDIKGFDHQNIELNHIHGTLNSNPIFGFGDEVNEDYKKFELKKNNELFKNIKSYHYSSNQNYFRLIRFIESEPYQVSIFGHSCGLSDRTMLKEIFENENCVSIKIFHHKRKDGSNDFFDKTCEIYRHFGNKGEARKKIVPFESHHQMPQTSL